MDNRTLIAQLRIAEHKIRRKIEDLRRSIEKELSAEEVNLSHILGTIAFYESQGSGIRPLPHLGRSEANHVPLNVAAELEAPKLRGLTHKQAVIVIAKHNNGIIKSRDAKKLMIRGGVMSDTKNSSRMVHNAIKGTNRFVSISPGEYRLKESSALPLSTSMSSASTSMLNPEGIARAIATGKPVQ